MRCVSFIIDLFFNVLYTKINIYTSIYTRGFNDKIQMCGVSSLKKVVLGAPFPPETFDWHKDEETRNVMR